MQTRKYMKILHYLRALIMYLSVVSILKLNRRKNDFLFRQENTTTIDRPRIVHIF